jgi:hypothetical protein
MHIIDAVMFCVVMALYASVLVIMAAWAWVETGGLNGPARNAEGRPWARWKAWFRP